MTLSAGTSDISRKGQQTDLKKVSPVPAFKECTIISKSAGLVGNWWGDIGGDLFLRMETPSSHHGLSY